MVTSLSSLVDFTDGFTNTTYLCGGYGGLDSPAIAKVQRK
jgi:hypothetical protein